MGNLWQFFGLPDPEAPAPAKAKKPAQRRRKLTDEAPPGQMTLMEPVQTEVVEATLEQAPPTPTLTPTPQRTGPSNWSGPVTPDGEPFHDLSIHSSTNLGHPDRALRYVSPDAMHRLPLNQIGTRAMEGDTMIIDLRTLIHMETQVNACRRQLKHLGDNLDIAIFALDDDEKLLLVPGNDVTVDVSRHDLGLAPLLL